MNSKPPEVAVVPESTPEAVRPLPPKWLIGLLLFLWLAWICFLVWAGRNDWNTTRPPDADAPGRLKVMPTP